MKIPHRKRIFLNSLPAGPQYGRKFREMISLSESAVNDAMDKLGFEIAFVDGKPNYVLYLIRTEMED
jgi:hypothetical protein